jgi:predicted alpha/beta hydrolase
VRRHIEVKNATTVMGQYQKHIKNLETNRGYSEEINGDYLRGVILQESAPALERRLAAAHHVFTDAALADVDAEFEQLAVDARCAPTRVLPAHPADQIPELARNDRSPRLAAAHLPGPEQAKAGAMPSHDRFWLDDGEHRTPISPEAGQTDPQ